MKKIVSVAMGLAILVPSFAFAEVPAPAKAAGQVPPAVSAKPAIAKGFPKRTVAQHVKLEARIAHLKALREKLVKREAFLKAKEARVSKWLARVDRHLDKLERMNAK
jgi:hypothetical protein